MRKFVILSGLLVLYAFKGQCCTTCNKQLQDVIFDSTFYPNLLSMLSAFIVLGMLLIIASAFSLRKRKRYLATNPKVIHLSIMPLSAAAIVLGIGIGGFIDGIFLHQILQWHEMLTNRIPANTVLNKSVNTFWDGIFHLFTLITTVIGIALLWKVSKRDDANRSGALLIGGILLGWGIFNIVEGIIDHHILKLHNVREVTTDQAFWNYGFLGVSVIFIMTGLLIIRTVPEKLAAKWEKQFI